MSARASFSFCFARTWAGITGAGGVSAFFFRQRFHAQNNIAAKARTLNVSQSQSQGFGMSTGGLMSRKPLVADPAAAVGFRVMLVEATFESVPPYRGFRVTSRWQIVFTPKACFGVLVLKRRLAVPIPEGCLENSPRSQPWVVEEADSQVPNRRPRQSARQSLRHEEPIRPRFVALASQEFGYHSSSGGVGRGEEATFLILRIPHSALRIRPSLLTSTATIPRVIHAASVSHGSRRTLLVPPHKAGRSAAESRQSPPSGTAA